MLTPIQIARYKAAGYTQYVDYEVWRPISGLWVQTGYPTVSDALPYHKEAIARRIEAREIRAVSILQLEKV